jgi:hypothetical protein
MLSIRDNKQLTEIILIILKIGNFINYGTKKGAASSFNVDLFSKLSGTKGAG